MTVAQVGTTAFHLSPLQQCRHCALSALPFLYTQVILIFCRGELTATGKLQTLAPAKALGPLGYAAGAAFLVGFAWETVADLQKFWFKSRHPDKCAPDSSTLHLHVVHDARHRLHEAVTVAGERGTAAEPSLGRHNHIKLHA